jgi:hypothetical protein
MGLDLFVVSARTNKRHHHLGGGNSQGVDAAGPTPSVRCTSPSCQLGGSSSDVRAACMHFQRGEGERERERALGCYYATALDIEVDPQRRGFGSREADFALQRLVECRALERNSWNESD